MCIFLWEEQACGYVNAWYARYCVSTTEVSGSLLCAMEEAAVAAQEYPAEFLLLMHNGDGDGDGDSSSSRVSRVHGEREGTILFIQTTVRCMV